MNNRRKKPLKETVEDQVVDQVVEVVEEADVEEVQEPKLYGVATCQLADETGAVILEQGEEALIIGETDENWQIEKGFVSKKFILKKFK